jgi:ankyrin repeat protein
MSRQLPARTTLDQLRTDAKRWLKALRANDAEARARLTRVSPDAPANPGLREIQHALALEYGFAGWTALKDAVNALLDAQPAATASATATEIATEAGIATAPRESAIKALHGAAAHGDTPRMKALLDAHPDIVNARSGVGARTALHPAAGAGHDTVVALLLERGADPNIRCDGDSAMPLHFAAEGEHLGVIRLLIEHGADPIGHGDYHELDVIGWATCFASARPDIVDYLLAHGAVHNIFSAVATSAVEAIRALAARALDDLDRRMDLTNRRRMPLHLAIVKKQPAALAALLDLGAKTDVLDEAALTPLDEAALSGETAMAQLLIDRGAELRLPAAVALQRAQDVERLMREDPDCLKPGQRWGRLIVRASETSAGHVVETLIRLGASVDVWDDPKTAVDSATRFTPLHAAAWRGNVEAIAALLKHGANPAAREEAYCGTPAGWANYAGHPAARDLILEGPIDLFEAVDFDLTDRLAAIVARDPGAIDRPFGAYVTGRPRPDQWWPEASSTPLSVAMAKNRLEAARILIELGAAHERRES